MVEHIESSRLECPDFISTAQGLGCLYPRFINIISSLSNINPETLDKREYVKFVISELETFTGCPDVQILELVNNNLDEICFLKYYKEHDEPIKIITNTGINRYCIKNKSYFISKEVDHESHLVTGIIGSVNDINNYEEIILPYILAKPDKDEESVIFYPLHVKEKYVGVLKLCDFRTKGRFSISDIYYLMPITEVIANILLLYFYIEEAYKMLDETLTTTAEMEHMVERLQVGERLTYQYLTASSHLHELAALLSGMNSDKEEFRSIVYFSHLPNTEKQKLYNLWERNLKHRNEALKMLRKIIEGRPEKIKLNLKPHNIKEIIESQILLAQTKYNNEKISFKKSLRDANIAIKVDKSSLNYLFRIMINNAAYAVIQRRKEHREISFSAIKGKKNIIIRIEDNGTGIEFDKIKKIFDAFYTTKGAEGSGIGLYWAKKTIEEHNGKLQLDWTEVNKGTRFVISLPINNLKDIQ
ncbi:MAG TPA: HAMP domain-containing sensor histidine kinase [Bacteroidales bacterium]|nr:HAMP domain-containing sensor histidine kinase [Bacteroidales bacterium]HSA42517.1 HAMP domain-containing sensor histidine kinase [Bacteroidales bacterium]